VISVAAVYEVKSEVSSHVIRIPTRTIIILGITIVTPPFFPQSTKSVAAGKPFRTRGLVVVVMLRTPPAILQQLKTILSAGQVSMDVPEPSGTHSLHQNSSKPYSPTSFETECRALVIVPPLVGSVQCFFAEGGPRVSEGIWNGSEGTFASMMSVSAHLPLQQTLHSIDYESGIDKSRALSPGFDAYAAYAPFFLSLSSIRFATSLPLDKQSSVAFQGRL
jgi:hypothetical protein